MKNTAIASKLLIILLFGLSVLFGSSSAAYASAPSNNSSNKKIAIGVLSAVGALGVVSVIGTIFALSGNGSSSHSFNLASAPQNSPVLQNSPVPSITSISPVAGPLDGNTTVVINGSGFIGVTAVKFGNNNAASFVVNSAVKITAVSPAGVAGIVDITVTTPNGTSAISGFTYTTSTLSTPPTLTSIAITPADLSIVTSGMQQFTAIGSYSDSHTEDLTDKVTWSLRDDDGVFTIGRTGLITASSAPGASTVIKAELGAIIGTTTVTVVDQVLYYAPPTQGGEFDSTCSGGEGVLNNPYTSFCIPQALINSGKKVAAYFAPGTYTLPAGGITVPSNWSLYGRKDGYLSPASSGSVTFSGIVNIDNSTCTVDSISISGANASKGILIINSGSEVTLRNVNIANDGGDGYGIQATSKSIISFEGSNIIIASGGSALIAGIEAENSTINFDSGTTYITAQNNTSANCGLYLDNTNVAFNGAKVNISATGNGGGNTTNNYGILLSEISKVNLTTGTISVSATGAYSGVAIYSFDDTINEVNFFATLAPKSVTITAGGTNQSYGLYNPNNDTVGPLLKFEINGQLQEVTNGNVNNLARLINFNLADPNSPNIAAISWYINLVKVFLSF